MKKKSVKKTIRAAHWKRASTMDSDKYKIVSQAILKTLTTKGMRYGPLVDKVYAKVKKFDGAVWSYVIRCLRELETQGKVVRKLGPPVMYFKKASKKKK